MENVPENPKKKLLVTSISAILFTLILMQRHAGFIAGLFAIPFIIWIFYALYVVKKRPTERKWYFYRAIIWVISFLIIFFLHLNYHKVARDYGNNVAILILEYKKQHGTYPSGIEQVGLSRDEIRRNLGMGGYSYSEDKPSLFYAVTYIVFDTYSYNFETNTWEYKT